MSTVLAAARTQASTVVITGSTQYDKYDLNLGEYYETALATLFIHESQEAQYRHLLKLIQTS